MMKFGLIVLGIFAAIVALANLGSIIGLAISGLIAFVSFHYMQKSTSSFVKFLWGVVLVISLITAVTNVPAFIGIIALVGIYYVWKKWKENEPKQTVSSTPTDDPFVNFERQWDELTK